MKRERILEILKNAKNNYICDIHRNKWGMCKFIDAEILHEERCNTNFCSCYAYIPQLIPEFNAEFLGGDPRRVYWWDKNDTESRIRAFDKLIAIYEKDDTICKTDE